MCQTFHGLNILCKYLDSGINNDLDMFHGPVEIRRQSLNRRLRVLFLDFLNTGSVVGGASIGQIITIDRRNHDIFKGPLT